MKDKKGKGSRSLEGEKFRVEKNNSMSYRTDASVKIIRKFRVGDDQIRFHTNRYLRTSAITCQRSGPDSFWTPLAGNWISGENHRAIQDQVGRQVDRQGRQVGRQVG